MNLFSKLSKEQLKILFEVYLLDIQSKKESKNAHS